MLPRALTGCACGPELTTAAACLLLSLNMEATDVGHRYHVCLYVSAALPDRFVRYDLSAPPQLKQFTSVQYSTTVSSETGISSLCFFPPLLSFVCSLLVVRRVIVFTLLPQPPVWKGPRIRLQATLIPKQQGN